MGKAMTTIKHSLTRKLVEHGGNRVQRVEPAVPGAAHCGQGDTGGGGRSLGRGAERERRDSGLALHYGGCPDQAQTPLSFAPNNQMMSVRVLARLV